MDRRSNPIAQNATLDEEQISRKLVSTADAAELPGLFEGWVDMEYCQLDAGRFEGSMNEVRFGNTRLVEEAQNKTVLKRGAIRRDRCNIGFFLDHSTDGRCLDRRLTASSISLLPGGLDFDLQIPPGAVAILSFDRTEFLAAATLGDDEPELDGSRVVTCEVPSINPLADLGDLLLSRLGTADGIPQADADYLNRLALGRVLDTFASRLATPIAIGRAKAYRTVRDACEFIDGMASDPVTVLDICRAIDVSRRTLQSTFIDIMGIAPLAYLRRVRLNRARYDLIRSHGTNASVAQIATHWGFWHLGRFAVDYRRFFGESPSATLQRAKA